MRISLVGDVMLGRLVARRLERAGRPEYPWGDTIRLLKGADLSLCNLECAVSDRGDPWGAATKAFHFRTPSKNVACLKAAGMDGVSLANNHTLDYGAEALLDTIALLDANGIAHAGAGRDIDEAIAPAFFRAGGQRAAMIAFTDNEPGWEALEGAPGVHYVPVDTEDPRALRLFEAVRKAAKEALVIVSAHWGPNWGYRPEARHIPFGRRLIESGARIVFGHSCHVFQGIEFHGGGVIIYSAGDFVDDYAIGEEERNDESFVFELDATGAGVSARLYPTVIDGFQARRAPFPRAELIAARMRALSGEFGTIASWDEGEGCLYLRPGAARGLVNY